MSADMSTDFGIVTAYGYALSKGYTGTEEEFAEQQARMAGYAADINAIKGEVSGHAADINAIKSTLVAEKTGAPADFSRHAVVPSSGKEIGSSNVITSKRYYSYLQDGLVSVEVPEPYGLYCYGWKRAEIKGVLDANGEFANSIEQAGYLRKINLADYAGYSFKFTLCRLRADNSFVEVTLEEAANVKFTFKRNDTLSGRRVSVMGDSISSFTGYVSPDSSAYYPNDSAKVYYAENMFWKVLADRNGMSIDTIDAYAGSTVADKWQKGMVRVPFYDDSRVNRLGTPDIIIIEGGINDYGGNPLGDYPAAGDYSKTEEFRTAYSLLLNKLKTKYTAATIVCLSMISPRNYNNNTFPEKQVNWQPGRRDPELPADTTLHTFAEFNDSIKQIAAQYQCAYCDITDLLNYYINPTSSLGAHWYFNLHMEVAFRIEQFLKQIYA